jgi:putative Mg2+ transporter-C (MgtC) family protein
MAGVTKGAALEFTGAMEILQQELAATLPNPDETVRVVLRLLAAALFAAVIGYEREASGKSAGLRTHMLVGLGSAIFAVASLQAGMEMGDISRVVQGVAAGIGFIGAGAILKMERERHIEGLTTAAAIWLTAALGVAAGVGRLGVAAVGAALAWVILAVLARVESRARRPPRVAAAPPQNES